MNFSCLGAKHETVWNCPSGFTICVTLYQPRFDTTFAHGCARPGAVQAWYKDWRLAVSTYNKYHVPRGPACGPACKKWGVKSLKSIPVYHTFYRETQGTSAQHGVREDLHLPNGASATSAMA